MEKLKRWLTEQSSKNKRLIMFESIAFAVSTVIDHSTDHRVANLFGMPEDPVRQVFEFSYIAPFLVVAFWIASRMA